MKTPAIIFTVFIIAGAAIIALNKTTPEVSSTPATKAIVDDITAGSANQPITSIQFKDSVIHAGKIEEGKLLDVEFEFTNTGTEMLIIKNVSASCGCTIPEKPEEPIAPGQSAKIKATFDSKGRAGLNQKAITVIANTKETVHTLIFDVEVNNPQYAK
ncbi:MAG: hypothetical protein RLZZ204_1402 [Bacteroidota bacterium]|jgi:hypothetical protein